MYSTPYFCYSEVRKVKFMKLVSINSAKYPCQFNICLSVLTIYLWGQKGQCITKDSPQQQPVSFSEASKGWGWGTLLPTQ